MYFETTTKSLNSEGKRSKRKIFIWGGLSRQNENFDRFLAK